jgi:hypothetical protein
VIFDYPTKIGCGDDDKRRDDAPLSSLPPLFNLLLWYPAIII